MSPTIFKRPRTNKETVKTDLTRIIKEETIKTDLIRVDEKSSDGEAERRLRSLERVYSLELETELRGLGYDFRVSNLNLVDISSLNKLYPKENYGYLEITHNTRSRKGSRVVLEKEIGIIFPFLRKAYLFTDIFEAGGLRKEEKILERKGYEIRLIPKSAPLYIIKCRLR